MRCLSSKSALLAGTALLLSLGACAALAEAVQNGMLPEKRRETSQTQAHLPPGSPVVEKGERQGAEAKWLS